jgi:hypothetical protein
MSEQERRDDNNFAPDLVMVTGTRSANGSADEGGEAACFANLVCPECGAVTTEGHQAGCALAVSRGDDPPDPAAAAGR